MNDISATILVSITVSVICNKILAVYTFNVIDGYVRDVLEMVKKLIRDTYQGK